MAYPAYPWRDAFLAALEDYPVISHACRAAGISRSTVKRARKEDKEFADACDDAIEAGVDRAEAEAFRRGVVGYEELVIHKGHPTPLYERDAEGKTVYVDSVDESGVNCRRPKPLVINGVPQYLTVRRHSDAMLALVLKARRKAYSTERTELTGGDGEPLGALSDADKAARVHRLMLVAQARKALDDIA